MTVTYLAPDDPDADCALDTDGMPYLADFVKALGTWVYCQQRLKVTVPEAAIAFNATPDVIRQAAEEHPWLLVIGDEIESDGE